MWWRRRVNCTIYSPMQTILTNQYCPIKGLIQYKTVLSGSCRKGNYVNNVTGILFHRRMTIPVSVMIWFIWNLYIVQEMRPYMHTVHELLRGICNIYTYIYYIYIYWWCRNPYNRVMPSLLRHTGLTQMKILIHPCNPSFIKRNSNFDIQWKRVHVTVTKEPTDWCWKITFKWNAL